jgi:hypothetical protein
VGGGFRLKGRSDKKKLQMKSPCAKPKHEKSADDHAGDQKEWLP